VLESKLEYQLVLWKIIREKSARKTYNIQRDNFVLFCTSIEEFS